MYGDLSTTSYRRFRRQLLVEQFDQCALCGCTVDNNDVVDHVIPLSRGGMRMCPDNLQVVHHRCNVRKKFGPIRIEFRLKFEQKRGVAYDCPLLAWMRVGETPQGHGHPLSKYPR